jgi:uncharacterized Zn finger protein
MSVNSVADLVEPVRLQQLATPANYRMGQGIAASGAVELDEFGPLKVTARATSGTPRRIELTSTPEGLEFRCTCSAHIARPCKHVVAVGLTTWEKAPKPRRR